MSTKIMTFSTLTCLLAITACATQNGPGNIELASNKSALKTMEAIAVNAKQCWFKSGNADFKPYRMEPELQSYSGRPRILIVSRNDVGGRPLLVIEAEGQPTKVSAYGALMSGTLGNNIAKSIDHWTNGGNQC